PAAGQRALLVPRLRGRRVVTPAGRAGHRLLDRFGLLRRGGPALARPAGDGRRQRPGALLAALHAGPHQHHGRRRRARRRPARGGGPGPPGGCRGGPAAAVTLETVRVLAAMSGGVDSAVAAARAVDAGFDVTGVHLALARNPQTYRSGARGCCTLEDARDARRAADVIGIPFYVWDLAGRVHQDGVHAF